MNFSPFGGHFPASIPTIHQFAAKFGHDGTGGGLCPTQDSGTARYPTNSVPSFTQHHPPPQQHIMPPSKYQSAAGYVNQGSTYPHQANVPRLDKRQGYDQQQELAQEICAAMLHSGQEQKNQQQQQQQQNNDKVRILIIV